jgi:ketosteroid isomerase-like protein
MKTFLALAAFAAVLVIFPAVAQTRDSSASTQTCEAAVRSTLERLYAAWSDLDPAKAARFYDKDPKLIFFDVAPLKYTGWSEYAVGVPKAFAEYKSGVFQLNNDLQVHCHGDLAWAAATWHGELTKKTSGSDIMEGRYTAILLRRVNEWLVVHEHMSVSAPTSQGNK